MSFDIFMKLIFDYCIFVLLIQFLPDFLEFPVNQDNIHQTLY